MSRPARGIPIQEIIISQFPLPMHEIVMAELKAIEEGG
jgi:hypothetical protein